MQGPGFDLGQFLQEARAQGVPDSEGSFTVAKEKALAKLAKFSLPGAFDWVLKIVQAANAWNCQLLQIRQTRVATSFYMRPPEDRFPTDAEIVSALRQGAIDPGNPIHELCAALRALVDQAQLSFVLALRRNNQLGEPIYFGDDVSALGHETRRQWAHLERDGLRLTVSHFRGKETFTGRYIPTLFQVERRDVEIARVLEQRAFASTTTISLDGREVTNPFHNPHLGGDVFYRPLSLGVVQSSDNHGKSVEWSTFPVMSEPELYHRPRALDRPCHWCLVKTFEWMAVYDYRKAWAESMGALNLDFYRTTGHQLFWLRNGVVVNRQTLFNSATATTVFLLMEVSDLGTDLTGLAVNQVEGQARLEELKGVLATSVPALRSLVALLANAVNRTGVQPVQQARTLEEVGKLEAGYSIFTEGLRLQVRGWRMLSNRIKRKLRNRRGALRQERLLADWSAFVERDLKSVADDLTKPNRDREATLEG